jgi:molybdopterin/thiamine biosynthesis adenylyltransferase
MPVASLTADSLRRYARHIVLPDIGEAGQAKLLASSVLVIGAGGLGSAALAALAASGVGRIGIVEPDRVELSNLQRQLLFETADIGRFKAQAAADRLTEINGDCKVEVFLERLTAENARGYIEGFDLVVDGSDNFETRFALHAACLAGEKTLVSAAITGFSAQLSTFKAYLGPPHPCYCCLIPVMPDNERSCAQEGIIGPLAGMLGSMQALEAIKELLGIGQSLSGRLLIIDALTWMIRAIALPRDPHCRCCGTGFKYMA